MAVKHYVGLIAWQRAMDLVETVYRVTRPFPKDELSGLTSHLRRAAVSIPSNIAEGQGRQTTSDFLHFLTIAYGSLSELETQTIIAARLKYLADRNKDHVLDSIAEVARLLNGLKRSLRAKNAQPH